ncbi:hypothetical protein C8J56DRAFT_1074172 [Mycena floridula]|nr:hypothetical protein C8J56DRAFT_1074172 [Mycena floridula]
MLVDVLFPKGPEGKRVASQIYAYLKIAFEGTYLPDSHLFQCYPDSERLRKEGYLDKQDSRTILGMTVYSVGWLAPWGQRLLQKYDVVHSGFSYGLRNLVEMVSNFKAPHWKLLGRQIRGIHSSLHADSPPPLSQGVLSVLGEPAELTLFQVIRLSSSPGRNDEDTRCLIQTLIGAEKLSQGVLTRNAFIFPSETEPPSYGRIKIHDIAPEHRSTPSSPAPTPEDMPDLAAKLVEAVGDRSIVVVANRRGEDLRLALTLFYNCFPRISDFHHGTLQQVHMAAVARADPEECDGIAKKARSEGFFMSATNVHHMRWIETKSLLGPSTITLKALDPTAPSSIKRTKGLNPTPCSRYATRCALYMGTAHRPFFFTELDPILQCKTPGIEPTFIHWWLRLKPPVDGVAETARLVEGRLETGYRGSRAGLGGIEGTGEGTTRFEPVAGDDTRLVETREALCRDMGVLGLALSSHLKILAAKRQERWQKEKMKKNNGMKTDHYAAKENQQSGRFQALSIHIRPDLFGISTRLAAKEENGCDGCLEIGHSGRLVIATATYWSLQAVTSR